MTRAKFYVKVAPSICTTLWRNEIIGERKIMLGETGVKLGEIDCPEGLFLDVLDVDFADAENSAEGMYENSAKLTEEYFDKGDRYSC